MHVPNTAIHDENNNDETHFMRNEQDNPRAINRLPSWFVVQLTITASLGGCLFGYDLGAIAGTLPQLTSTFDLDDRQKELSKHGVIFFFIFIVRNNVLTRQWTCFYLLHLCLTPTAVSILYVGGALGACFGGSICDRIGRKVTIMLTDVIFILGAMLL